MTFKLQKLFAASASMESPKSYGFNDYLYSLLTLEFFRSKKTKIVVLRLQGIIGKAGFGSKGMTLESLNSQIEEAFSNPKTKAVCLVINSPGGSPVQSELIADRIITLSKEKKIPVYSFVEDVAASGGYWLACSGKEIYASRSSIVGSVGVISAGFGLTEAISKLGIERRVYTSGKNKSVLDPFSPVKEDDIELIKKIQVGIHKHFIDHVKTRRRAKLTQDDDFLFSGEFWNGELALDYGLIDGIDNLYSFIHSKFGDKVKIQYIGPKESWFKKKLGVFTEKFSNDLALSIKTSIKEEIVEGKYNIE